MNFTNKIKSEDISPWGFLASIVLTILTFRYVVNFSYLETGAGWFFTLILDIVIGSSIGVFVYGISLELLKPKGVVTLNVIWALFLYFRLFPDNQI